MSLRNLEAYLKGKNMQDNSKPCEAPNCEKCDKLDVCVVVGHFLRSDCEIPFVIDWDKAKFMFAGYCGNYRKREEQEKEKEKFEYHVPKCFRCNREHPIDWECEVNLDYKNWIEQEIVKVRKVMPV